MKKVWERHLGLGDAIVLAGAVVWLIERGHGDIIFPCRPWDLRSIETMFADYPQVEVRPVNSLDEMIQIEGEKVRSGLFNTEKPYPQGLNGDRGFDAWFYHQLGVPLEAKWDCFPIDFGIAPSELIVVSFLHEDDDRGYSINRERIDLPTLEPVSGTWSIFDWVPHLMRVKRLDVINSSFLHLCEVLPLPLQQEKCLHRYARPCGPVDMPKLRHQWEILD